MCGNLQFKIEQAHERVLVDADNVLEIVEIRVVVDTRESGLAQAAPLIAQILRTHITLKNENFV